MFVKNKGFVVFFHMDLIYSFFHTLSHPIVYLKQLSIPNKLKMIVTQAFTYLSQIFSTFASTQNNLFTRKIKILTKTLELAEHAKEQEIAEIFKKKLFKLKRNEPTPLPCWFHAKNLERIRSIFSSRIIPISVDGIASGQGVYVSSIPEKKYGPFVFGFDESTLEKIPGLFKIENGGLAGHEKIWAVFHQTLKIHENDVILGYETPSDKELLLKMLPAGSSFEVVSNDSLAKMGNFYQRAAKELGEDRIPSSLGWDAGCFPPYTTKKFLFTKALTEALKRPTQDYRFDLVPANYNEA